MNTTLQSLIGHPSGGLDWYKVVTWGMFVALVVYVAGSGLGFF